MEVSVNARFLSRPLTGVDRVAVELTAALSELFERDGNSLRILRPSGPISLAPGAPSALFENSEILHSKLKGAAWEQFALPMGLAPNAWLLNLCNVGPLFHRRQMVMIHDAQVFSQPDSYSARFRSWYKTAQPTLGRVAKRILTVSEHSRKELVRFRVAPADKIAVVPNGADHILRITPDQSILQRHKLVPDGFLLAIGSLAPHKNLPTIITAAQSLGDRSLPLVIAGGGDSTVFAKAGIQNSAGVKLLGRVSDAELRALYDSARGLLFPSLTEGFGLPPIEAMTCGCPVVASTGGAVPEVCSGAAYLLAPQDQAGWRGAMEELSANAAFAQRLRDAGRKRAADYTWAKAAQKLRSELVAVGALTQAKSRRHA